MLYGIVTDISSSRAMAVAAHEGRAYIYMLKSMDELRADFDERSRLEPIKEASLRSLHPVNTFRLMIVLVIGTAHLT